jgi:hypothetical protein
MLVSRDVVQITLDDCYRYSKNPQKRRLKIPQSVRPLLTDNSRKDTAHDEEIWKCPADPQEMPYEAPSQ